MATQRWIVYCEQQKVVLENVDESARMVYSSFNSFIFYVLLKVFLQRGGVIG
jgi:hypothetical protein